MTVETIFTDGSRVRRQSDLPGATDQIVFYMGRAQPLSVAGVPLGSTDPMVVDDTVPERVRRYSQTDEASVPPPPPPPPPPSPTLVQDDGTIVTLDDGTIITVE